MSCHIWQGLPIDYLLHGTVYKFYKAMRSLLRQPRKFIMPPIQFEIRFFFIFKIFFYSDQGLLKTQYSAWIPIAKASIKEPRKKKNKNKQYTGMKKDTSTVKEQSIELLENFKRTNRWVNYDWLCHARITTHSAIQRKLSTQSNPMW